MAAMHQAQVSAVQVGSFFVRQYYQIVQQTPHVGHQFYNDMSTAIRIDGDSEQTATSMMQIHTLLTTKSFTSIEIKTLHSLGSWDGGVLVMVSGFVQMRDYSNRRKFVQTFFLAPQEKGYFVLNDIFHLLDEEETLQPPTITLAHEHYESNSNVANHHIAEPVLGYTVAEEIQTTDYVSPVNGLGEEPQASEYVTLHHVDEREYAPSFHADEREYATSDEREYVTPHYEDDVDTVDQYSVPKPQQQLQQVSAVDGKVHETPVEELAAAFPTAVTMVRDNTPSSAGEFAGERPKQTYASILRLAKGQPGGFMPRVAPVTKITPGVSDTQVATAQQAYPATSARLEDSSSEAVGDATAEDEGDVKSVYVGNLSSSISASDLEDEFKNFGRIKPNGVTVRSRKESGGFYAFVEFEDAASVQNALQASPIVLYGRQIYVEERKPNSGISRFGGGRRGSGGSGYQSDASRGRFGGRGGFSNNDREQHNSGSSRTRGNGVLQRVLRQERGILGSHATRNNGDALY